VLGVGAVRRVDDRVGGTDVERLFAAGGARIARWARPGPRSWSASLRGSRLKDPRERTQQYREEAAFALIRNRDTKYQQAHYISNLPASPLRP
jgi:hypothetical protein